MADAQTAITLLKEAYAASIVGMTSINGTPRLQVKKDAVPQMTQFLHTHPKLRGALSLLWVVDHRPRETRYEICYLFTLSEHHEWLLLCTDLHGEDRLFPRLRPVYTRRNGTSGRIPGHVRPDRGWTSGSSAAGTARALAQRNTPSEKGFRLEPHDGPPRTVSINFGKSKGRVCLRCRSVLSMPESSSRAISGFRWRASRSCSLKFAIFGNTGESRNSSRTSAVFTEGVALAEKVSGDTSFGHSLCYCQAVESLLGC